MRRLYVFPVRYPFTNNIECFLHDEMPYLSKEFDEVIFVPLKKEVPNAKDLPVNCKVLGPVFKDKWSFMLKGLFNAKGCRLLWADFFKNGLWHDYKRLRVWIIGYITINNILNSEIIKGIKKKLEPTDVCYFYWGKWSNILSRIWHDKAKFISRFHGWGDLWEYDYNDYFPLREEVVPTLKYASLISTVGESYFKKKYPDAKTIISRLGSFDNGIRPNSAPSTVNVISCSSLWPLKRVELILESVFVLASMTGKRIKWTHLGGDGNALKRLKKIAASKKKENLEINLLGAVPHEQVMTYYKTNPSDVFINLSTTEGVPVSIMEAISFDIPAIATNVGGTSDVVANGVSGELVSGNPSPDEVAVAIQKVLSNRQSYSPRNYWNDYFNADKNYKRFAKILKDL